MTVKDAIKHVSRMLDLMDKADASNMDSHKSKYDNEAIATLKHSTQTFSKRITAYLDTQA